MKKIILPSLLIAMFIGGVAFAQALKAFPDVKPTDWFYNDVNNMVSWGVIQGNDDGTFKPSGTVNRAELSAMWNRYDKRVQGLVGSGGGVATDYSAEIDMLRFTSVKQFEQSALMYSDLATVHEIAADLKPSCIMLVYYYNKMKQNYDSAEYLSGMITTPELKIDTSFYQTNLSDYRSVYAQCEY
jgi:hypothetical protein